MDSNLIECPICANKYLKEKIEKHVDTCLRCPKEKPATRRITASSPKVQNTCFFEKKVKRKRSTKSADTGNEKKQCLDTSTESEVIKLSDTPPLPNISIDLSNETNKGTLVTDATQQSKDRAKSAKNSFQETLLKWSQSSSSTLNGDEKCAHDSTYNTLDISSNENVESSQNFIQGSKALNGSSEVKVSTPKNNLTTKTNGTKDNELCKRKKSNLALGKIPLAEQMRPKSFDDYFGQEAVNSNKILKELFYSKRIPSLLLWGPPGCGKVNMNKLK